MDTLATMQGVRTHLDHIIKLSTLVAVRLSKDPDSARMVELAHKLGEIAGSATAAYCLVNDQVNHVMGGNGSASLRRGLELAGELWILWDRQCCKHVDVNTLEEPPNPKDAVTLRETEPGAWSATVGHRHRGEGASKEEAVAQLLEALCLTGIPESFQSQARSLAAILSNPKWSSNETLEIVKEGGPTLRLADRLNGAVQIHNHARNELDSARKKLEGFGFPKDDANDIEAIAVLCERDPTFREQLTRRLFGR